MTGKLLKISADWRSGLLGTFLLLLVLGVYNDFFYTNESPRPTKGVELQTIVPADSDLVVLDLANEEAIDILLEDYARVSLFEQNSKRPLVTGLKVFRAPKNPQKFVALVPKRSVVNFVTRNQQLIAVVEPKRASTGTVFVTEKEKSRRSILIGTETR
ncbi:MAG: hypothetical protein AAF202_07435 [Pseudomonadota bacterium]